MVRVPAMHRPPPKITARAVFDGDLVSVNQVVTEPGSEGLTRLRELRCHTIVLPYRGVFATHFGSRDSVVTSANHALLLSACVPHRYSSPGAIGDRALALMWSDEALARVAPTAIRDDRFDPAALARAPLLPPRTLLARERFLRLVTTPDAPSLAVEEEAVTLLNAVLQAARRASDEACGSTWRDASMQARRVERVKSAVLADVARPWTLSALAEIAGVSPLHLARIFRAEVGTSVYEYVTQARLALALERLLDTEHDLSTIALDVGFATHSHFTARFRARFGVTPSLLRAELRCADQHDDLVDAHRA